MIGVALTAIYIYILVILFFFKSSFGKVLILYQTNSGKYIYMKGKKLNRLSYAAS